MKIMADPASDALQGTLSWLVDFLRDTVTGVVHSLF